MEHSTLQPREEALTHLATAKSELYKEEFKSALYAALFGASLFLCYSSFFSVFTVVYLVCAIYLSGFFKPTIKNQIYLGDIVKKLEGIIKDIDNPPVPETPKKPWKTN